MHEDHRALDIAIRTKDLTKVFSTRQRGRVTAVDSLDLTVVRGETFGLVGPDGAGKTTTVRLLAGLLRPTRGRASVLGYDPIRDGQALRMRIGYMAQQSNIYDDLTVEENLRFFANLRGIGSKERSIRIAQWLHIAGLKGFERRLGGRLSGGMRKKLGLACMLLHDPELLFLDEPTPGVDPVSRRELWDLLMALRAEQNVTILVCTPYMDEVERCHRVGLLYDGRLVAQATPEEIEAQLPGELVELRPSDFFRAKALALDLAGVLEVQTFGNRLRLFVDDAAIRGPQIAAEFEAHGIAVEGLRTARPRIEEAFTSLVKARGARHGA